MIRVHAPPLRQLLHCAAAADFGPLARLPRADWTTELRRRLACLRPFGKCCGLNSAANLPTGSRLSCRHGEHVNGRVRRLGPLELDSVINALH